MKLSPELASFAGRVVERRLPNGLTVLVYPRRTSATAHFAMAFRAGAVDEPEGRSGMAHLYEHMAFMGTPEFGTRNWPREKKLLDRLDVLDASIKAARLEKRDKGAARLEGEFKRVEEAADKFMVQGALDDLYSSNGARGLNAFTSNDETCYIVSLPSNRLELWTTMESRRVVAPVLRHFFRERNVVIEELRIYDDSPNGRLFDLLPQIAFTAHHYRVPVIGWKSDLEEMAPQDLREFFQTYYRPDRAVIAVVGDVDPAQFLRLVRRDFGSWKGGPEPRPMSTVEPEQRGERRATEYMQSNPLVAMGWPVPTWGHPDKVAVEAMTRLLGRGESSRLHTALVKRDKIAVTASAFNEYPGSRYPHLLGLFGAPRAPHTADEVEQALVREAYRLKDEPVTAREMEKTISMMEADILRQLSENWWLPNSLAGTHVVSGDWRNLLYTVEWIRALTPADIQRVANSYLVPQKRTVVQVLPRAA